MIINGIFLLTLCLRFHQVKAEQNQQIDLIEEIVPRDKLIAYDCTNFESERTVYGLVDSIPCKLQEPNIKTEIVEIQVLQKQEYSLES